MKKSVPCLATLSLLMMTQASYGQMVVMSDCQIYNQSHSPPGIVITVDSKGGWDVTINGAMSLGTNDKSVVSTAFYFRKPPNGQGPQVGATVQNFIPPQKPGDVSTFSFSPVGQPIGTIQQDMGTWYAYATMKYIDGNGNAQTKQGVASFVLPPPPPPP